MAGEVDVLIVGGGAAGSMLLLELARRGVEARCVDRLPAPAPTSRAITVHARTAEIFERIDQRLIDRCLARALPSKGYVLHFVDELGKRRSVRPGLDFTTLRCRYPRLFIHGQHDTEQLLRDYLQETTGRGVEWGTELVDIRHAERRRHRHAAPRRWRRRAGACQVCSGLRRQELARATHLEARAGRERLQGFGDAEPRRVPATISRTPTSTCTTASVATTS